MQSNGLFRQCEAHSTYTKRLIGIALFSSMTTLVLTADIFRSIYHDLFQLELWLLSVMLIQALHVGLFAFVWYQMGTIRHSAMHQLNCPSSGTIEADIYVALEESEIPNRGKTVGQIDKAIGLECVV